MRRHVLAPLAALVLLAVAPGVASAAPDWTPPASAPIASDAVAGTVQNGYETGGGLTQAYVELVSAGPPIDTVLHVRARPAGGEFAEQLRIAATPTAVPVEVDLAVAPSGAAVVGWTELTSGVSNAPRRYRASYRPAGSGAWEPPVTILTDAVYDSSIRDDTKVGIARNGVAAFAISHIEPDGDPEPAPGQTDRRLDVAVRPVEGPWAPAARMGSADQSSPSFDLAFDAAGNLTVAYNRRFTEGDTDGGGDDFATLAVRQRSASTGTFGAEEDISGSEADASVIFAPELGAAPDGSAVVAYQYHEATSADAWAATRSTAAGAWTAPERLVTAAASGPEAAGVAPDGQAYVVYGHQGESNDLDCTGVVRGPVGGAFSAHRCLGPAGLGSGGAGLAFLGDDAVFGWDGGFGDTAVIQGARWLSGAPAPEAPRDLDTPGESYDVREVLADGAGSVAVVYGDFDPEPVIKVTAYDAGAPGLTTSAVPATAQAGVAAQLSASPFDLWSPLAAGQPTWDFGDGSPEGVGASVAHTYAAPGSYTVTLRAADALGNTASRTFTITVSAPSPPPGGGGGGGGGGGSGGGGGPSNPPDPPNPAPDVTRPLVKLSSPAKRKRKRTSAWRTLKGTVADPAPSRGVAAVEVAIYRTSGRRVLGLRGGRFKKTSRSKARKAFVAAKLTEGRWSLRLPKLAPGRYTILVRARDAAGNRSTTITKTLRLK